MANLVEARNEEQALEQLYRDGFTDGLPVVIPTPERVMMMVLASGYDGDVSLGEIGPSQAAATVEAVAANAVMAGCLPEYFPVVVAAVKAISDPSFDLTEIQVTTHGITPLIIVNGPVREQVGLASGFGLFGPGFRANATIGRAIRLVMMNIGGGRPGISDMAVMGSPAKFTFCAAENEEESPWEPLHVARGFDVGQSTVTAFSVEGGHSVICAPMPDDCVDMALSAALDTIGSALGGLGANSTYIGKGDMTVILNPQIAEFFAEAGMGRRELQEEFALRSRHPRRVLRARNPFMMPAGNDEDMVPERDPSSISIVVAGGRGGYAMVCPTLGVSKHHHKSVTKVIELDQHCEIPLAQASP